MAGMFWTRTQPPQVEARLRSVLNAIQPGAYESFMIDEMSKIQIEEVKTARQYTETKPSAKSGRPGRVDTGNMRDHITGETRKTAKGEVTNRVGFLAGVERYFKFQTTTGFKHNRTGDFIEPTLALKDAHEDVKPLLRQAGINVLRKVNAAIRKG